MKFFDEDETRRREFLLGPPIIAMTESPPAVKDVFVKFSDPASFSGSFQPTCWPGKENVAGSGVHPMFLRKDGVSG